MVKIQVNSQGKAYLVGDNKLLVADSDTITATNKSSSAIISGAKVWLEKSGQNFLIKDAFYPQNTGFRVYGSPTINSNSVASGFSTSNYLQSTAIFPVSANTWEIQVKLRASSFSGQQCFISDTQIYSGNVICIKNQKVAWWASSGVSGGYTWDILNGVQGISNLSNNTDYWLKFVFTGTHYICYLSTTGAFAGEETTEIDITKPTKITGGYVTSFGVQISTTQSKYDPFTYGSIDLSQCYIKINGKMWWSGTNPDIDADNLYSGIAQENIAINGSGSVKTMIPEV